jgi:hypothetical protein
MFLAGFWIVAAQNLDGIGWGVKELISNIHTDRQTNRHTFPFIYKKEEDRQRLSVFMLHLQDSLEPVTLFSDK